MNIYDQLTVLYLPGSGISVVVVVVVGGVDLPGM